MSTQNKDFVVKNGLQVGGSTNLVNYTSSSPSNPFVGQLWIDSDETSAEADLSSYLSLTAASALYLNIVDAQNTYLPIGASANYVPISASSSIVANYIPVSASQTYLTRLDADIIYAPLISASFTGTPTAPTAVVGTNTKQIATTEFVYSMVTGIDGGIPSSTYDFSIDGGGV